MMELEDKKQATELEELEIKAQHTYMRAKEVETWARHVENILNYGTDTTNGAGEPIGTIRPAPATRIKGVIDDIDLIEDQLASINRTLNRIMEKIGKN